MEPVRVVVIAASGADAERLTALIPPSIEPVPGRRVPVLTDLAIDDQRVTGPDVMSASSVIIGPGVDADPGWLRAQGSSVPVLRFEDGWMDTSLTSVVITTTVELGCLRLQWDAAHEEMRAFAHRAAHDLKSPLSIILGTIDLLARSPHDPSEDDLYSMVSRSVTRLIDIVDQVVAEAEAAIRGAVPHRAAPDSVATTVDVDIENEFESTGEKG